MFKIIYIYYNIRTYGTAILRVSRGTWEFWLDGWIIVFRIIFVVIFISKDDQEVVEIQKCLNKMH